MNEQGIMQKLFKMAAADKDGPLRLQSIGCNEFNWTCHANPLAEFVAPSGYEFVVRKDGNEIGVFRRKIHD